MKRILITGANSYIGTSFEKYIKDHFADRYTVDTIDMIDGSWRNKDFSVYDSIFHVAGMAHVKETNENREQYYRINRDLTVETAEKAKADGVLQFVVLSSMSVYGMLTGHITKKTECHPKNAYGRSKLEADNKLIKMQSNSFSIAILRPPMVYGKGCKGNYQLLRRFAVKYSIFPDYKNKRSMIYIENLCEFVRLIIDRKDSGLFFPQNQEYVCTVDMVDLMASCHQKRLYRVRLVNPLIRILKTSVIQKVFGSLTYEKCDCISLVNFENSIILTEV